jgi:pyruvate dehydrogenase E2 component (dihydrolipoamide acetyltransferase)
VVTEIHVHEGEIISVGQLLLSVENGVAEHHAGEGTPQPTLEEKGPAQPIPPAEDAGVSSGKGAAPAAGPAVHRLARERGVDLHRIQGTGPEGRITEEDVRQVPREAGKTDHAPVEIRPLPDFSRWGPVRRIPLSSIRRKIGENMAHAWMTIPHVHQFHEADITDLEALRHRYASRFGEQKGRLTFTVFLLKALVHTLKAFPHFSASLDPEVGELILKDYFHIGVAVDTEAGLIVPVIRDVDRKNALELALELDSLARRTRSRQITLDELQGGTFSLSNLGGIGGSYFTPIIRHPEVAVLGAGRAMEKAVFRGGQVIPRTFLPLCVAYDHRVIVGAEGARFISHLAGVLEDFEAILLGL